MTDEERKQFINEYCRNVGDIKIKCDDCKFVENCVDYGWKDCKKFTPKQSESMTNEEWLHTLTTEQLARIIYELMWHKEKYPELCVYPVVDSVVEWLKQPHTVKE